jgi:SpoVK/Ycf46/Vps4 family AAA+-type ATPase
MEKSLSGNKGGMESHETTKRVFQQLLTWMQDKKADVFLVATANSVQSLPPELIRPGRIDATFWIDLPDTIQRAEIFGIHLRKLGRTADMFLEHMPELMKACAGFSGAEIEVWIKESLVKAYSRKHKNLELADLMDTVKDITPIAKLMANDIENARKWAKDRGTKNASIIHEEAHVEQKPRKIVSGPAS